MYETLLCAEQREHGASHQFNLLVPALVICSPLLGFLSKRLSLNEHSFKIISGGLFTNQKNESFLRF